jgi:pilus assembly protein Flp/PilA
MNAVVSASAPRGISNNEGGTMNAITQKFVDFIKEEEGLTTVEYAIAGALVGLAVVTAFTDLGTAVGDTIRDIIDAIDPPAAP